MGQGLASAPAWLSSVNGNLRVGGVMWELDGVRRPRGGLCEGGQGGGGCAETVCFSRCLDVERLLLSLQMFAVFIAAEAGDPTASLLSFLLALQPGVSAGLQLEEARGGGACEASGSLPRLCVPNPYPALLPCKPPKIHEHTKRKTPADFLFQRVNTWATGVWRLWEKRKPSG